MHHDSRGNCLLQRVHALMLSTLGCAVACCCRCHPSRPVLVPQAVARRRAAEQAEEATSLLARASRLLADVIERHKLRGRKVGDGMGVVLGEWDLGPFCGNDQAG